VQEKPDDEYLFAEKPVPRITFWRQGERMILLLSYPYNKLYHPHSLITAHRHTMADTNRDPAQQPVPKGPEPAVTAPPAMQEPLIELTDLNWERTVERSSRPVAVMFYSPTCAFCHQMEPYFRNYAREYKDTIQFARLDIMTSPWTAERYGVRSTPTFKFFCDGKPVQEMVGAVYPALLKKMVDEVLVHGKECAKNSTAIDYEITGYG
jgi:thioredoxin-like negative regulator of GroEL